MGWVRTDGVVMADFNGIDKIGAAGNYASAGNGIVVSGQTGSNRTDSVTGPGLITSYQMLWKEADPGEFTTRTWVSVGSPDPTGASYTGPKNGATPISGAIVVAYWSK